VKRLGPIYDLGNGLRLQDLDGGCGSCGKRLAEVIHDPTACWRSGAVVCIDCGTVATQPIVKSYRAPGLRVAECLLCRWTSLPTDSGTAARLAMMHQLRAHGQVA
jgi:hypothetical protein